MKNLLKSCWFSSKTGFFKLVIELQDSFISFGASPLLGIFIANMHFHWLWYNLHFHDDVLWWRDILILMESNLIFLSMVDPLCVFPRRSLLASTSWRQLQFCLVLNFVCKGMLHPKFPFMFCGVDGVSFVFMYLIYEFRSGLSSFTTWEPEACKFFCF